MHAAKFDTGGSGNEKKTEAFGKSNRIEIVAIWFLFGEKLYISVRKEYYLKDVTARFGAILDCFVPSYSSDERLFEVVKRIGTYEMKPKKYRPEEEMRTE